MKNAPILNRLAGISALACACAIATPASATVTFNLDNVALVDGGTLTGSFSTSDDLSVLEDFSISSAGGTGWPFGVFAPTTYTLADAVGPVFWTAAHGISAQFSGGAQLNIFFSSVLTDAGAGLDQTTSETQTRAGARWLLAGSVSAAPSVSSVPEPASWAMMIAGFGLVGMGLRSRRSISTVIA